MTDRLHGGHVVSAWAEHVGGPGWHNRPIWVLVRAADHSLHLECIQPSEHTETMAILFNVSAEVHETLKRSAEIVLGRKEPR